MSLFTPDQPSPREELKRASRESIILYQQPVSGAVVVPLTRHAAEFWARDTQWKNSAIARTSLLEHYLDATPLLIAIHPSGEKFQLWVDLQDLIFVDRTGAAVSRQRVAEDWHLFRPLIHFGLELDQSVFSLVPDDERSLCTIFSLREPGANPQVASKISRLLASKIRLEVASFDVFTPTMMPR